MKNQIEKATTGKRSKKTVCREPTAGVSWHGVWNDSSSPSRQQNGEKFRLVDLDGFSRYRESLARTKSGCVLHQTEWYRGAIFVSFSVFLARERGDYFYRQERKNKTKREYKNDEKLEQIPKTIFLSTKRNDGLDEKNERGKSAELVQRGFARWQPGSRYPHERG